MLGDLLNILAPPLGSDHSVRRTKIYVCVILTLMGVGFSLVLLFNQDAESRIASIVVLSFVLVCFFFLVRGDMTIARVSIPLLLYATFSILIWRGFGLHSVTVPALTLVIVFSALLSGRWASLLYMTLSTMTLAGVLYGEHRGWVDNGLERTSDAVELLNLCLTLVALAVALFALMRHMEMDRDNARESESTTRRLNDELQVHSKTLREQQAAHAKVEAQLLQSQKMEAVGQLAGGVAHDINNQLTVISGFTGLALESLREGGSVAEELRTVLDASSRAADITKQLLAFSRQQPLDSRVLNLNPLIQDTTTMIKRLVGDSIEVEFIPEKNLGNARFDSGQIQQVLMNLTTNARDAMAAGGRLTIETTNIFLDEDYRSTHAGATPGRYVMMAVTDTGCGIEEEIQARIFDPFFTTKKIGEGTGLGLATTYGIVKQHQGYIEVHSEPRVGTAFKVYLPRVDERVEDIGALDRAPHVQRGTETVAVVEDDAAVREVTRRNLESQGYRVLSAAGPSEAEELFATHGTEIDLLLTDISMPDMDGPSLYHKLSASKPDLKVLYMSGYRDKGASPGGLFDDLAAPFIPKPFTKEQLAQKVQEALGTGCAWSKSRSS